MDKGPPKFIYSFAADSMFNDVSHHGSLFCFALKKHSKIDILLPNFKTNTEVEYFKGGIGSLPEKEMKT
jgi:hypothetical protein